MMRKIQVTIHLSSYTSPIIDMDISLKDNDKTKLLK